MIRTTLKFLSKLTVNQVCCILMLSFLYITILVWKDQEQEEENDIIDDPDLFTMYNPVSEQTLVHGELVPESHYPSIVWWYARTRNTHYTAACPNNRICENYGVNYKLRETVGGAYVFYGSKLNFADIPIPRRPHNVLWALVHEESPRNVEMLLHEPVLKLFNCSSTFSIYSDVPFPLAHMGTLEDITSEELFLETSEKNYLLSELAPVLYIQSDCHTSTERDIYVAELMKYVKIDSYGDCLRNKQKLTLPSEKDYLNSFKDETYLKFVARYKFHIAIENGVCEGYLTEKFWRPIHVGSVPIYFGSPSAKDWSPNNKSAIFLEDFPTPALLSDHIKRLMENDTLYEEYLQHKTKGIITNHRLLKEIEQRPYQTSTEASLRAFECFICERLYELRENSETPRSVVTKKHHDCPEPISALSLNVNPTNSWVSSYRRGKQFAEGLYDLISWANDYESYYRNLKALFVNIHNLRYYGGVEKLDNNEPEIV